MSRDSPFATLRKAYRALAKLIHPDKLGGRFAGATKAFQQLCHAFDTLTAPDLTAPKMGKQRKSQPALARDNHNCFRTKVRVGVRVRVRVRVSPNHNCFRAKGTLPALPRPQPQPHSQPLPLNPLHLNPYT